MTERPRSVEVDLPKREEIRFILPIDAAFDLLAFASRYLEPVTFSDRPISRTIYLNNQHHEVPWKYSLKAREYFHRRSLGQKSQLSTEDIYHIEVKGSSSETGRTKKRFRMNLAQAPDFLTQTVPVPFLTAPLRPYIADEYERFHFCPKKGEKGARVTLDIYSSYFLIDENGFLSHLGEEPSVRIEVKTAPSYNSQELNEFLAQLSRLQPSKTISKKMAAYSLEALYYRDKGDKPKKELKDVEIESKLVVTDSDPFFFSNRLFAALQSGMGNFVVRPTYPYVFESGSINSYYLPLNGSNTEGVKFLSRPTITKAILKSEGQIVENPYGLGCVLRRKERKSDYFPRTQAELTRVLAEAEAIHGSPLHLVGEIERLRKAIWVTNLESGRVYHVSIDRCSFDGNLFFELEVEYTGTTKREMPPYPEQTIIKEIAELTHGILKTFPLSVIPNPVTKIEWARQVNTTHALGG